MKYHDIRKCACPNTAYDVNLTPRIMDLHPSVWSVSSAACPFGVECLLAPFCPLFWANIPHGSILLGWLWQPVFHGSIFCQNVTNILCQDGTFEAHQLPDGPSPIDSHPRGIQFYIGSSSYGLAQIYLLVCLTALGNRESSVPRDFNYLRLQ